MTLFFSCIRLLPSSLIVLGTALVLNACATSPSDHAEAKLASGPARTANQTANTLLQTQKAFHAALEKQDAQAMFDAVSARETVFDSVTRDPHTSDAVFNTSIRMLQQALRYAGDDAQLQERIEKQIARLGRKATSSIVGNLTDLKKMIRVNDFVRVLDLQAHAIFSVELGSDSEVGTIVYVEHEMYEPVVLSLENQQGITLCKQKNPRGYLICRHKSKSTEELRVKVSNLGATPTRVLLIRNQ